MRLNCPLFLDKSSELIDLSQSEKVAYLLALRDHGMSVVAISQQYHTPRCTFYYWLSRYEEYRTYENRSPVPHRIYRKDTEDIKTAVIDKHRKNPRL